MKKIAVIGFGFMGVVHAQNILASENLILCAIVDNRENIFIGIENTGNKGQLDLSVERLKKMPVYKTLEECCQKENLDAVSICVPLFLHYELAKKALNLGLDVLLEKPFCPELEQCQELINLAKEKKLILMVAHCVRFAPEWEFLANCISDKRYGELKLFSTNRTAGEPTWGVWQDEKIKQTCGGALMDLLIHDIDHANSCLGTPSDIKVNFRCDDYWEIALKYPDNPAKISIKGGFLHRNTPFASEYVATFERGSVRYNTQQPGIIHIGINSGQESVQFNGDMYVNEIEYFAKCIYARNKPEKCLPEASLQTIEVCKKITTIP
jgi:predicted dehydrogenase